MRQLDEQTLRVNQAASELEQSRKSNKGYFDQDRQMLSDLQQLHIGNLVLISQSTLAQLRMSLTIVGLNLTEYTEDLTFYKLEELDGTHLKATFAGNRIKRFFSHAELDVDRT